MNDHIQPDGSREPWLNAYPETRKWIYRVLAAGLVIIAGFTTWEAVTAEQWLNLAVAVLNLSGSIGFLAASDNVPKHDA